MKNKIYGIVAILSMCAIPYVLFTGYSIGGVYIGNVGRAFICIIIFWFIREILLNKTARQRRIDKFGTSNFFVALFKEEKKQ
jgi:hypothetical protein